MNYTDLQDGFILNVYFPSTERFYNFEVTKRLDEAGGFSISNFDMGKENLVSGQEHLFVLRSQEDIDKFYYMELGPINQASYAKARLWKPEIEN